MREGRPAGHAAREALAGGGAAPWGPRDGPRPARGPHPGGRSARAVRQAGDRDGPGRAGRGFFARTRPDAGGEVSVRESALVPESGRARGEDWDGELSAARLRGRRAQRRGDVARALRGGLRVGGARGGSRIAGPAFQPVRDPGGSFRSLTQWRRRPVQ